ncbi:reverse transcriptase domain-containing protein [Tanacetum coccineum]
MWTREADKVFEDMKKYIEKLPTLVAPKARESLIIYLTASRECVSITERGKDKRPIYFVSRVLQGAELNYPIMEKLLLALVHATRRLNRMARWAIELREHDIKYKPRNVIKAQGLTNLLAETQEEDKETDFQRQEEKGKNARWRLYTDEASGDDGPGLV